MKIGELIKQSAETLDNRAIQADFIDYYHNGPPPGLSTGWFGLDEYYKLLKGQLNVVSGVPGSGKSEIVESMAMNAAVRHDWRVLIYSPENWPPNFLIEKLITKYIGKPFRRGDKMSEEDVFRGYNFFSKHFKIINASTNAPNVDTICNSVLLEKPDMVIIDPWNEMDAFRPSNISETDMIGLALTKCRRTARHCNTSFWIVCHPAKMQRNKEGEYPEPSLYDLHGSSHWFNKSDNALLMHRTQADKMNNENIVKVIIAKIKNRFYGKVGEHFMKFNPAIGTFKDEYTATENEKVNPW